MEKASIGRRLATAALCACLAAMGIPAAALAQDGPAAGADASATNDPVEGASAKEAGALAADGLASGEGEASRPDPVVLASFEDPDPASYDVAADEDLPALPESLTARDGDGGRIAVEGVSWECADADPAAPGAHVFTAALPAGYEIASGARLPQVIVTVSAPQAPEPAVVAPRGTGNGLSGLLRVTFDDGDKMSDAISKALEGKNKADVTDILVAGDATEITGDDWTALKDCFKTGSDWSKLVSLRLSDMGGLTKVSGVAGGNDEFDRLHNLYFPAGFETAGDYAFSGCSSREFIFPFSSLKSIGKRAFSGCTGLTSASFSSKLVSVGEGAFQGCSQLKDLWFDASAPPTLGTDAFKDVAAKGAVHCPPPSIPDYTKALQAAGLPTEWTYVHYELKVVFNGDGTTMEGAIAEALKDSGKKNSDVTDIAVTGDATSITEEDWEDLNDPYNSSNGQWSNLSGLDLSGMEKLKEVSWSDYQQGLNFNRLKRLKLPDGLETIGDRAFTNSPSLGLAELPASVTSIGSHAFFQSGLALDELPSSLKSIGDHAFGFCSNLDLTKLPDGVTSIGVSAFNDCPNLALTSLPDGVTSIADYAFYGCASLALTTLPDSLKSVGDSAFEDCSKLTLTALLAKVSSVGERAFSGCTSLKVMTFPSGLATVGASAFQGCTNLAALEFHGSAPALGEGAFAGVSASGELYFPQGGGYVQGAFGGDDLKGWGFYDMAQRELVDAATGAKVSGVLSSNAGLLAQKGGLHQPGTCDACDAMREREAAGVALAELCLSLSGGRLWGGVEASIPVGAANDGREVAVLHCADGTLEEAAAKVAGGYASGAFASLSPFAVVAPKDGPTPVPAPKPVPTPGSGHSAIAATGDGLGVAPWLALALALASAAALAVAVRSRSARR